MLNKNIVKSVGVVILLIFFISLFTAMAQESINATGGNASGSRGFASYSVGQTSYQTTIGTNGLAAEGVQQPYEILVVTGIEKVKGIYILPC